MSAQAPVYSPRVLDLFRRLPGARPLAPGAGARVQGEAMALDRGAWVRIEARVEDGALVDCVFSAWGCPHVLAACAWACAHLAGQGLEPAVVPDARRLAAELEAPAEKRGRLLVVEDAMRALWAAARAVQSR